VRKAAGCSPERHGPRWWWVDQGGCLDSAATGPYGGGSRSTREKTVRRRNRGPARPPTQAQWKNTDVLGLGSNPNRHKKKKTSKRDQAANRFGAGEAQR
jgi:hypothetical protein